MQLKRQHTDIADICLYERERKRGNLKEMKLRISRMRDIRVAYRKQHNTQGLYKNCILLRKKRKPQTLYNRSKQDTKYSM